jgi:hypothetical protein
MPITTKLDKDRDLVEISAVGEITNEDMFACQALLYEHEPACLQLWDMSGADLSHATTQGLRRFVELAAKYGQARRGCRTAVLVESKLQYAFGRMSQLLGHVDDLPFSLKIFKDREEALAWLIAEG